MRTRKALLERQMTRKEFLLFLGSSFVILLGLPNLIKLLQRTGRPNQQDHTKASHGFGSSKFGV
jgi:hypothetical protein